MELNVVFESKPSSNIPSNISPSNIRIFQHIDALYDLIPDQHRNCSSGLWRYYGGYCYLVMQNDRNMTWQQASLECEADNGELAVIGTNDDNEFSLRNILLTGGVTPQKPKVYIGESHVIFNNYSYIVATVIKYSKE